ncbi:HAD family hydrolase [Candidatus Solirubrobacter pratensis]|uniref:HAD family hydrolase n=1 Tax=Candidatus Solirubrobacter pratensis TaxID=1298857 RepID=UPI0003F8045F|nr:HAD family phosphatase [Candidatus Solirubrobacter pratensis]
MSGARDTPLRAVVTDFGGVLTTPLLDAFARANAELGISVEALGAAMRLSAERAGEPPLFKLERGQISEPEFIGDLAASLGEVLGRSVDLDGYGARLMGSLERNEPLLAYYRRLHARGIRFAILTNNVREWQPIWRAKLAADDIFELIVDSGFEGVRKPEPEIYALTLERLGLPGGACAFVDDLEVNLPPAREAGMHAIHYRDPEQAIAELDALF